MYEIEFAVPNKNAHFQAIQGPKSLVHHRVCRLICYAVTLKIPDCCPGRYKRNYDIGMDSIATELCRSKNCNPYASNVEQAKPQSFGLGADARSTYSLECESMLKHSQMARDASSQSPKTSPVKGDTMSIFRKAQSVSSQQITAKVTMSRAKNRTWQPTMSVIIQNPMPV